MYFKNREDAGRQLAQKIKSKIKGIDLIIGIPRGGVPIAREVSSNLNLPFEIIINEKIPLPGSPGVGCGSVSELGVYVLNNSLISRLHFSQGRIDYLIQKAKDEIRRKKSIYSKHRIFPDLDGASIVLVDDGLASGFTALSAIRSLRKSGCARVILAVPTASNNACKMVKEEADELIALQVSYDPFYMISKHYDEWKILSDEGVAELLLI